MSTHDKWFLVTLKPNGLNRAIVNLERQNIRAFMPMRLVRVAHGRQKVEKKQPLFPGYLFVKTATRDIPLSRVNSTFGVAKLVTFGSELPAPVPEVLIEGLKLRCDENGLLHNRDDVKIGEMIRITSGPFANFIAKVETLPTETRLGILLNFLGEYRKTEVRREDVERVANPFSL